jgi:hypothetical protein
MILSKGGFVRPFQKEEFCPQPLPEMIRLDFLLAMAAKFGYGLNGSDVRCGLLPEIKHLVILKNIHPFNWYSLCAQVSIHQ